MSATCTCPTPGVRSAEGVVYCERCGELLRDSRRKAGERLEKISAAIERFSAAAFIDAVADRVVERLREGRELAGDGLLSAAEVARRYGVSRDWAYRHADDLRAVRLGKGPKAPLRFDPSEVERRLAPEPAPKPDPKPRMRRRRSREIELLPVYETKSKGNGARSD